MKTIEHFFALASSGKTNWRSRITLGFCMLAATMQGFAQNDSGAADVRSTLNNWLLGGLLVLFTFATIYILRSALMVLDEHGKSVQFSFPMFRRMSQNSKTVAIVILVLAICGIIWAINF